LPSVYDIGTFCFENAVAVFDGEYHYPVLRGEMPIGRDGIALEYEFSSGAVHVSDGRVEVTIRFSTDSENYLPPEPVTAFVEILPMLIEVDWEYSGGIYNGKAHVVWFEDARSINEKLKLITELLLVHLNRCRCLLKR
jgi:hypothetical protein